MLSLIVSCQSVNVIKSTLESPNSTNDNIIEACHYICKHKNKTDSTIVASLLTNIFDERISTSFLYYGETPYVERIKALSVVTGINIPSLKNDEINAYIVDSFIQYAIQKKIISSTKNISLIHPNVEYFYSDSDYFAHMKHGNDVNWRKEYSWQKRKTPGILHN